MHALSLAIALLAPIFARAEDPVPFSSLVAEVTVEQPVCFGREFSNAQLRARPLQTVRLLRAKLSKQPETEGSFLSVEALLKGEKNRFKLWRQFFLCSDDGTCMVECDGGSVRLSALRDGSLSFRNHRFVLEGGCEGKKKTIFLDNKRGGDDEFHLRRLPAEFCAPDAQ